MSLCASELGYLTVTFEASPSRINLCQTPLACMLRAVATVMMDLVNNRSSNTVAQDVANWAMGHQICAYLSTFFLSISGRYMSMTLCSLRLRAESSSLQVREPGRASRRPCFAAREAGLSKVEDKSASCCPCFAARQAGLCGFEVQ